MAEVYPIVYAKSIWYCAIFPAKNAMQLLIVGMDGTGRYFWGTHAPPLLFLPAGLAAKLVEESTQKGECFPIIFLGKFPTEGRPARKIIFEFEFVEDTSECNFT